MAGLSSTTEPHRCVKCGASDFQKESLMMYGKLGVMGFGYLFRVHICRRCGYSEQYFVGKRRWV